MAIDDDTLARIRASLASTDRVDATRIDVAAADEVVVLRGAVANHEEAAVAAMIAERDVASVRNELQVDAGLREGPAPAAQEGATRADDRPPGTDPLAGRGAPTDVADALAENEPWDPPDEPSFAPTRAEERGVASRDVASVPIADEGEVASSEGEEPSAADLSAAELRRDARPDDTERR
jgi:hypothetical protein